MKKEALKTAMLFLLIALAVSVSTKTVISEQNLDTNGDIVADLLVDLGDNYHISSVDISYLDINGQLFGYYMNLHDVSCRVLHNLFLVIALQDSFRLAL